MSSAALRSSGSAVPFVGRATQLNALRTGLEEAIQGRGSGWIVAGPAGIGKTRLLDEMERVAKERKFSVRRGTSMIGTPDPLFLLEQLFRTGGAGPRGVPQDSSTLLFVEEVSPEAVLLWAPGSEPAPEQTLFVVRESPRTFRPKLPPGLASAPMLWLTRTEGPENLPAGDLDRLAERLDACLQSEKGPGTIVFAGFEYLLTQNGFLPSLRLIQHLRDAAEERGGHVRVSLRPETIKPRERALLLSEGELFDTATPTDTPALTQGDGTISSRWFRYQDQLERELRRGPALFLVDDLQWGDLPSLQGLRLLFRNLPRMPVLFLASLRVEPGLEGIESSRAETIDQLQRDEGFRRMDLSGLSPSEVEVLCRESVRAGHMNFDRVIEELVRRTDGNPYFLTEILRQGVEITSPRSEEQGLSTPQSIRRLLRHRLDGVAIEERRLLERASLLGVSFAEGPLNAVGEGSPADPSAWVLEGLHRKHAIVRPEPDRPGHWSFDHPLIWETVRGEIPPEVAQRLALQLAEWHARHQPADVDTVARLYHAARSSDPGLAWIRKARDRAERMHAGEAMLTYVGWALDLIEDDREHRSERLLEELKRADGLATAGRHADAVEKYRQVASEATDDEMRWRALLEETATLVEVDPESCRSRLQAIREEIGEKPVSEAVRFELLISEADYGLLFGDAAVGVMRAREALPLVGFRGPSHSRAIALDHLAWCQAKLKMYREAEASFREGEQVAREGGEFAIQTFHMDGLAHMLALRGELEEARRYSEDAVTLARGMGDYPNASLHLLTLTRILRELGRIPQARASAQEAIRLADRFDISRARLNAHLSEVELAIAAGQWDLARANLAAVSPEREVLQRVGASWHYDVLAALLEGETGSPGPALEKLGEAPLAHGSGVLRVRARLLLLDGRVPEAVVALRTALREEESSARVVLRAEVQVLLGRALRLAGEEEEGAHLEKAGVETLARSGRADPTSVPWY